MKNRDLCCTAWRVGCLAVISAVSGTSMAQAEQDTPHGDGAVAAASDADSEPGVIIVTAQRRREDVEKVPISISVLTSRQIEQGELKTTEGLAQLVPGLSFSNFIDQLQPMIRGIGSTILSEGNDNSVAVYVDGVLMQTPASAMLSLTNIEQVEVLKGPQGTLFGRNAVGGVINITTKEPSHTPQLTATLGYGNYNSFNGSFYASTGLAENLAIGVAGSYSDQQDGFGRDIFHNEDIYKSRSSNLSGKLVWDPSANTSITISATYGDSKGDGACLKLEAGERGLDGQVSTLKFYDFNENFRCGTTSKNLTLSAKVDQDVGFANLVSITGYNHMRSTRPNDQDFTPADILEATKIDQADHGLTQEIQLQSKSSSDIKWIVGLYYLNSKAGYPEPNGITLNGPGLGGFAPYQIKGFDSTNSLSGFGQATIPVFNNTNLTVGARYTSDKRGIDASASVPGFVLAAADKSVRFNKFTYKIGLDHQLNSDTLLYADVSTGFKAGLFDLPSPGNPPVKPEELTAYEIGFKTANNRRIRINGAAYYYDSKNLQVVSTDIGGGSITRLLNAASSTIKGFDLDFSASLSRNLDVHGGYSYADGKYSSFPTALVYVSNPGGGRTAVTDPVGAAGKTLAKLPKNQFNLGAQYSIAIGRGQILFATNLSHQSHLYWDYVNTFRNPSQNLLSASIAWMPNDRYKIELWGSNLLDEKYAVIGQDTTSGRVYIPGSPLKFGIRASVKLGS